MEIERPTLKDPKEFALIRQMYFDNDLPFNEELDPFERLDRQEAKQRLNNKSSR